MRARVRFRNRSVVVVVVVTRAHPPSLSLVPAAAVRPRKSFPLHQITFRDAHRRPSVASDERGHSLQRLTLNSAPRWTTRDRDFRFSATLNGRHCRAAISRRRARPPRDRLRVSTILPSSFIVPPPPPPQPKPRQLRPWAPVPYLADTA